MAPPLVVDSVTIVDDVVADPDRFSLREDLESVEISLVDTVTVLTTLVTIGRLDDGELLGAMPVDTKLLLGSRPVDVEPEGIELLLGMAPVETEAEGREVLLGVAPVEMKLDGETLLIAREPVEADPEDDGLLLSTDPVDADSDGEKLWYGGVELVESGCDDGETDDDEL